MAERVRACESDNDVVMEDYERELQINKHRLDDHLEVQPDLFYRVAKEFERAVSRADEAKQRLEETRARVDQQIRKEASEQETKLTEASIQQQIVLSKAMKDAVDEHLRLRRQVGMWRALKEAFEQRGYSLKELVASYASGYFADITGRKNLRENDWRESEQNKREAGERRVNRVRD